jgi:hypothetical protein
MQNKRCRPIDTAEVPRSGRQVFDDDAHGIVNDSSLALCGGTSSNARTHAQSRRRAIHERCVCRADVKSVCIGGVNENPAMAHE